MSNSLRNWVIWFLLLVLAAFVVPFTLLSEIFKFYGAFLFWGLFALASIASIGIICSRWKD